MKEIIEILKNYRLDKKLFFYYSFTTIFIWILLLIFPKIFEKLIYILENKLWYDELFFWWIIWWILLICVSVFWYLWDVALVKMWETIYCKKSQIVRKKILSKNYKDLLDEWIWKIISRVTRWVEAESDVFIAIVEIITVSIFRMLIVLFVFYLYFPELLFVVLILTVILFVLNFLFAKKVKIYSMRENELYEEWDRILVRIITEHLSIKLFRKSILELNKSEKILSWIPILAWKKAWFQASIRIALYICLRSLELASYVYIWSLILEWTESISTLTMMMGFLWIMWFPLEKAANELNMIMKMFQAYKKLKIFLDKENDIVDWEKEFVYNNWLIELKNLSFWYSKDNYMFNDLNLNFLAWKKNALVWHSWSGKSTIIKLIMRLYDYDKWEILIDNQELKTLKIDSLYKHIWYLPQEPAVFDWTIKENLEYALDLDEISHLTSHNGKDIIVLEKDNPSHSSLPVGDTEGGYRNYDESILWEALKKARIDKMIRWLKDWLDTEIWERWVKLSWWEKQRLAIARIFLKNPEIIILDEPTSALDSISEVEITKTLNNLMKWKTSIIIAHRLQTVMNSDNILIIENWVLKWQWSHKKLISDSPIYKKLVDLQNARIID